MIISHKHKFIFIKTRKTAGTSVELALRSICGDRDIITPISPEDEEAGKEMGIRGPQNFLVPFNKYQKTDWLLLLAKRRRARFYNHISAGEIRQYMGKHIWETYFKFVFERNPFDKVVSMYHWRGGDKEFGSLNNFLHAGILNMIIAYDQYAINGLVAVDKIYKYEELEHSLADFSSKIGLDKNLTLPAYKAKSGIRKTAGYQDILTEGDISLIRTAFAREIHLLQYHY